MEHTSVLLSEAVAALELRPDDIVIDATLGGAGHFAALLEELGPEGVLIGIDADSAAILRARSVLDAAPASRPTVHLVEDNFRNLGSILDRLAVGKPTKVLFDLGWSGFQLADGRGFSFRADEPLLMTYGTEGSEGVTAADLVNSLPETNLAEMLFTLGEERFARGIAKAIVNARAHERILTTHQLVEAILTGTPGWYQHRRLHPATKTFQALRIAVNDELNALRDGLAAAMDRLLVGGRIAVITFHSIEDRIVKNAFRDAAYAGRGALVNRKPIVPSRAEEVANPRARSAKLRVYESEQPGVCALTKSNLPLYA